MMRRLRISKADRQRFIETIVQQQDIGTQRELANALAEMGCQVTQATISRDIHDLDLRKARTHLGRAKYVISSREQLQDPEQMTQRVLREFVRTTTLAQQLVVVRCRTGTASTVAHQLDTLNYPGILGTIAGDNTFVAILGTPDEARKTKQYIDRLREA